MKVVIDRCQAYYWSTYGNFGLPPVARKKRPGVFLASSGRPLEKGGSFEHSLAVIETWGLALGMKIVQKVLVPDTDRMPVTEASLFLSRLIRQVAIWPIGCGRGIIAFLPHKIEEGRSSARGIRDGDLTPVFLWPAWQ